MLKFLRRNRLSGGIAVLLLLLALSIELVLRDFPPLFSKADVVATITVNLALSYLSGLIFYGTTTYYSDRARLRRTAPMVKESKDKIVQVICWFFKSSGGIPTNEEVLRWTSATKLKDESNVGGPVPGGGWSYETTIEHYLVANILREVNRVQLMSGILAPEYLEAVYELSRCRLIETIRNYPMSMFDWKDTTLSHFDSELLDLLDCCRRLQRSYVEHYQPAT